MILVWGDWSAIEARILPWLSNSTSGNERLNLFQQNDDNPNSPDVYCHTASDIFRIPPESIEDEQRQIGKVSDLALGFGGGARAFQSMARNYRIKVTNQEAEFYKKQWRANNPWAVRYWRDTDHALIEAMKTGQASAGRVTYQRTELPDTLWAHLPSGTTLSYPFPKLEIVDKFGSPARVVTAIKANWKPKSDENEWPRIQLWGGLCAENNTQGEAATILKKALKRLDSAEWPVVLHTHDEIVASVEDDEEKEAKTALQQAMLAREPWMKGLPLAVKIGAGKRYGAK